MEDPLQNKLICRACLRVMEIGRSSFGYVKDAQGNLRDMIMCVVPEMDIFISSDPVICLPCIQVLVTLHSFKMKCISTETTIRSYLKRHNLSEEAEIDLTDLVRDIIKIKQAKNEETRKHLIVKKAAEDKEQMTNNSSSALSVPQSVPPATNLNAMNDSKMNVTSGIQQNIISESRNSEFLVDNTPLNTPVRPCGSPVTIMGSSSPRTFIFHPTNTFSQQNFRHNVQPNHPSIHSNNPNLSNIPPNHSNILQNHSNIPPSHSNIPQNHSNFHPNQSNISPNHSNIPPNHSNISNIPINHPNIPTNHYQNQYTNQRTNLIQNNYSNMSRNVQNNHPNYYQNSHVNYTPNNNRMTAPTNHLNMHMNMQANNNPYSHHPQRYPTNNRMPYPQGYPHNMMPMNRTLIANYPTLTPHGTPSPIYIVNRPFTNPQQMSYHHQQSQQQRVPPNISHNIEGILSSDPHRNLSPSSNPIHESHDSGLESKKSPPRTVFMNGEQVTDEQRPSSNSSNGHNSPALPPPYPRYPIYNHTRMPTVYNHNQPPPAYNHNHTPTQFSRLPPPVYRYAPAQAGYVPHNMSNIRTYMNHPSRLPPYVHMSVPNTVYHESPVETTMSITKVKTEECVSQATEVPKMTEVACDAAEEEDIMTKRKAEEDVHPLESKRRLVVLAEPCELIDEMINEDQDQDDEDEDDDEDDIILPHQKVFQCIGCMYLTTSSTFFAEHRRQCTKDVEKEVEEASFPVEPIRDVLRDAQQSPLKDESRHVISRLVPVEGKYICDYCDYKTTDKGSYRRHVRTLHPESDLLGDVVCSLCNFRTLTEHNLKKHMIRHEPDYESNYRCPLCSYETRDRSNYRRHIFIHNPDSLQCEFCDYKNGSPYGIKNHLKKYHNGVGLEDVDCRTDTPIEQVLKDIVAAIDMKNCSGHDLE